jgi:hypothetical protein
MKLFAVGNFDEYDDYALVVGQLLYYCLIYNKIIKNNFVTE